MARKSIAALAIVTPTARDAIRPPPGCSPQIAALFSEIVGRVPSGHFRSGDIPLIEQYAQAIDLAREAYQALQEHGSVIEGKASPWLSVHEKAIRASVSLSARLRLSPQHRADARSAGRANGPLPSAYGGILDDED